MISKSVLSIAAIAALAATGPLSAETRVVGTSLPTQAVYYGDLDLTDARAQDALNARVRSAAKSVCFVTFSTIPLHEMMETRKCVRGAIADAQPQIAAATLRARNGGVLAASQSIFVIRAQ